MVFQGPTTNENQSRLISGVITGLFLDGDSFTNAASQSAATSCLTNAAINALARAGQTFIPVEGNTGTAACTVFTSQQNGSWYLAVFNYSGSASVTNVDLSRAGIAGVVGAVDLWNGSLLPINGTMLTVSLNAKQARLFNLLNPSVLQSPQMLPSGEFIFTLAGNPGYLYTIQSSTNLVTWTSGSTTSNTTGIIQFFVHNPPESAGGYFYRAIMLP